MLISGYSELAKGKTMYYVDVYSFNTYGEIEYHFRCHAEDKKRAMAIANAWIRKGWAFPRDIFRYVKKDIGNTTTIDLYPKN